MATTAPMAITGPIQRGRRRRFGVSVSFGFEVTGGVVPMLVVGRTSVAVRWLMWFICAVIGFPLVCDRRFPDGSD